MVNFHKTIEDRFENANYKYFCTRPPIRGGNYAGVTMKTSPLLLTTSAMVTWLVTAAVVALLLLLLLIVKLLEIIKHSPHLNFPVSVGSGCFRSICCPQAACKTALTSASTRTSSSFSATTV
ncbi:hypothetical protein GQX74_012117 [Glossina fuscipes]|nr:hypothetical protein GQX74_012117 [Glossina fuscipes]